LFSLKYGHQEDEEVQGYVGKFSFDNVQVKLPTNDQEISRKQLNDASEIQLNS
jgi:ERCC4-related helicase